MACRIASRPFPLSMDALVLKQCGKGEGSEFEFYNKNRPSMKGRYVRCCCVIFEGIRNH